MNDEELRDYLKRFCFGREHLICSRDLVRQKNLRESDLRKKVIRQLKEMRAGLDAAICGLERAMETFTEPSDGGGKNR